MPLPQSPIPFINRLQTEWGAWGVLAVVAALLVVGLLVHLVFFKALRYANRRSPRRVIYLLQKYLYRPTRYIILLGTGALVLPLIQVSFDGVLEQVFTILLIATVAHGLIQGTAFVRELILSRYDVTANNNLHARKVYTQFRIIERVLVFLIIVFAVAVSLMTFDRVRQVGVSLLASAGVVGIIVGLAAQRSLGAVLAGVQLAIAQPIRIDDVVVVEGEWGRVEEIMLTYVVLRLWDDRRLIVPINYFIEKPFQNWTRSSNQLIGAVELTVDFFLPTEALRAELTRLLQANRLWDGRTNVLQVISTNDKGVVVRALVSAANADATFDLRCEVREGLLRFLQHEHPQSLPRVRSQTGLPATNEMPAPPAAGGEQGDESSEKPA